MFAAYWRGVRASRQVTAELPPIETGAAQISRKYDSIFARHGRNIPVPFLRALAYSESAMKPDSELRKGINIATRLLPFPKYFRRDSDGKKKPKRDSYWGLLQAGTEDLVPFNKDTGLNINKKQLFDAEINTMVATWKLNRIFNYYTEWAERHDIPELRPNWNSVEWVRLFVAGWNSGYSRAAGVQAAASWLKKKGIPVTHNNIFLANGKALKLKKGKWVQGGKTRHLKNQKKRIWQAKVVRRYFEQRGLDGLIPPTAPGGGGVIAVAALAALAALAAIA